jgi:hypothetical protein
MLKFETTRYVRVDDFNRLVVETYGRPYILEQRDGCEPKFLFFAIIPSDGDEFDYPNESIPEKIDCEEEGVSFEAWLKRDPKQWKGPRREKKFLKKFWEEKFFPDAQMLFNDLNAKGLIESGNYIIDLDC